MTPADYCDAMARWWRAASGCDVGATKFAVIEAARAEYRNDPAGHGANEEEIAAAWDRAAARLRGAK